MAEHGGLPTVTAFHPDNAALIPNPVPLRMPERAASYHSGMLGLTAGTQFTHRFEIEGVYDYFCQPHYSFGMVGRVLVGEAVDGPALDRPEEHYDLVDGDRGESGALELLESDWQAAQEFAPTVARRLLQVGTE